MTELPFCSVIYVSLLFTYKYLRFAKLWNILGKLRMAMLDKCLPKNISSKCIYLGKIHTCSHFLPSFVFYVVLVVLKRKRQQQ